MDKSIEWSMKTREEILAYGLSFPDTYQEAPFHDRNWQLVRVRESKKVFLWTYMRDGFLNLNVKADPQWRDFWRSAYPAVIPGYHQNKEHWNTIIVDGTIPAVGNALHKNKDPENIPCYRVVNAKGELSGSFAFGGENEQARRLMADGIEVVDGKVDLKCFGMKIEKTD